MKISSVFDILGTCGSLIVCASAIPQIVKICRTKSARDLSILYLLILMFGMFLLGAYAIYVRDVVFIFGNALSVSSTGILIALWFRYRK